MKKIIKFLFRLIIVLLIIGSCYFGYKYLIDKNKAEKKEEKPTIEEKMNYVSTDILKEKTFKENLKLLGKVSSSMETQISPLATGEIKKINVKVGDKVNEGDILAVIDNKSNMVDVNYDNAEITYQNTLNAYNSSKDALEEGIKAAKLQLENAKSARNDVYTSTEKQLKLSKSQLDSVVIQKGNTSKSVDTGIDVAKENVENAKLNLENFNKTYDETFKKLDIKKDSLINNMKLSFSSSFLIFDSSLKNVDNILGISEEYKKSKKTNESFDLYISAKDITYKNKAEELYNNLSKRYNDLNSKYNKDLSEEEILSLYSELIELNNDYINFFDVVISALDNTISSVNLDQKAIDGFIQGMKENQGQIIKNKSSLLTLDDGYKEIINTIDSSKVELETKKSSIVQGINTANVNLQNILSTSKGTIDSISSTETNTKIQIENTIESIKSARNNADNAVKIAESNYSSAEANKNSQLASTKVQLETLVGQKNSIKQQIENSFIKAPFAGYIIQKNIEIGSSVSPALSAFTITNSSRNIIKVDISNENVKYIKVGDTVDLNKNNYKSKGKITLIPPSPNSDTKIYTIEINILENDLANYLKLGDYVDVNIQKKKTDKKYIMVPFSSIKVSSNNENSIFIINKVDGKKYVKEKKIQIGDSNSKEVIIIGGINVGDKVVTEGVSSLSDGDLVKENNDKIILDKNNKKNIKNQEK